MQRSNRVYSGRAARAEPAYNRFDMSYSAKVLWGEGAVSGGRSIYQRHDACHEARRFESISGHPAVQLGRARA